MKPCKILEEICQRAVFAKVTPISFNLLFMRVTGASAVAIALANYKKAC
jgi:hypothetical protein